MRGYICTNVCGFRILNPEPFSIVFIPTFQLPSLPLRLPSSQSILMSSCELRSLQGRKRLQSNADETTPKRLKTNEEDEDEIELQPVAMKVKGKRGRKFRYVTYPFEDLIAYNPLVGLWPPSERPRTILKTLRVFLFP